LKDKDQTIDAQQIKLREIMKLAHEGNRAARQVEEKLRKIMET